MTTAATPSAGATRPVARLTDWLFRGVPGRGLVAFCGVLAFASLLGVREIFNDGDTFWHLAVGEWILTHRAVPSTDPFSYTFAGKPWQAHEWLAEVVMALVYRAGGWSGLTVLFAGAFGATAAILAAYLSRWLRTGPMLVALAFALACGVPSLLARPHLLALPIIAAWASGLLRAREKGAGPPWAILPLMLIWANLHGSFMLGLGLIAPFAAEAVLDRRERPWSAIRDWGLFGLAALALALANPQGVHGLTFPFLVSGMQSLPLIVEWRSADFSKLSFLEIAILEALFICLWRGVQVPAIRLLLLLGLLHLALAHLRHQAVFGVLGAMLLAEPIARARPPMVEAAREQPGGASASSAIAWGLGLAALVAAILRLASPVVITDRYSAPIAALAAVPADVRAKPVLNDYGFGGYLIFKGVRPYIDGRADMYGDAFMRHYVQVAQPNLPVLAEELEARRIAWTIFRADMPVANALDQLPGWRRLYSDKVSVVHVRRNDAAR